MNVAFGINSAIKHDMWHLTIWHLPFGEYLLIINVKLKIESHMKDLIMGLTIIC